jgi:signal transduction histidine kinase
VSRARRWWLVFAACNVVVALALVWITRVVLDLERRELAARAETDYQQSLRLAMWRMDSWLALLLAREAARPDTETDYVTLRFEMQEDGTLVAREPERLESYRRTLSPQAIHAAVAAAGRQIDTGLAAPEPQARQLETQVDFDARVACTVPRPEGEAGGHQAVVWLDPPGPGEPATLAFLASADEALFRGFVLDWPELRDRLLLEIRDLFPDARLERRAASQAADALGRGLANLPVTLIAEPPPPEEAAGLTPGRAALGIAWLAALLAAVAVGVTLRKSIDLGERRRRFVSAVTHELRTPLTTFQMYSEMLADGVVPTEQQRGEYLQTLKEESKRLSTMVANVLAHARLEERRGPRPAESMTLQALLSRLKPSLERRVESTPMTLEVRNDGPAEAPLVVDAEAVGQILGNLVDNAAKYANGTSPSTIHLVAKAANGSLVLTVRDHGPGIAREQAAAIFEPFARGGRDPSDPVPGVGLGLALARGLARDLGGELTLESPADGGARFRLELPAIP